MIKYFLNSCLAFCALLVWACNTSSTEVSIPADVLSKDSMVNILVDIHLLEASIDLNIIPGIIDPKQPDKFYPVFKKHNLTRQQYDSSLLFYSTHPALFNQVYDKVIAELSKKQAELNKH